MANSIMDKYHDRDLSLDIAEKYTTLVCKDTWFHITKTLFVSKLWEATKIWAIIYEWIYKWSKAVLKMQYLPLEYDEYVLWWLFREQNISAKIDIPTVLDVFVWNEESRYWYTISECIEKNHIFNSHDLQNQKLVIAEYVSVYKEYRVNCLRKEFIQRGIWDTSTKIFYLSRCLHRLKISKEKWYLDDSYIALFEHYTSLVEIFSWIIPMVFCHGHLTNEDIFKKWDWYIFMSTLFYGYRPEWYDFTFGLWERLLNTNDLDWSNRMYYVDSRYKEYSALELFSQDKCCIYFYLNMLERCIWSLLIDTHIVKNGSLNTIQDEEIRKQKQENRIRLFNHCKEKLWNPISLLS